MPPADAATFSSGADSQIIPDVVVSSKPEGPRVVTIYMGSALPQLRIETHTADTGGGAMPGADRFEDRLRIVEQDVAVIKERITHMPTKSDVQDIVSGAQSKIIWAIVLFALGAVLKWAWPFLFPATQVA